MPSLTLITIRFLLTSIIFIVGAYLIQTLSKKYNWKSDFPEKIKNACTLLSIFSLLVSVVSIFLTN